MNTLATLGCFLLAVSDCCGGTKPGDWDYQYEVINPATRSEYIVGKLTYKNEELPEQFLHVVTPIGEFAFIKARGWSGGPPPRWVPATSKTNIEEKVLLNESVAKEMRLGENELFRSTAIKDQPASASGEASMSGKLEERPRGAGADWFFAVRQSLWVNPVKVDAVAKDIVAKPSSP
jgi:hypothetical protein